MFQAFPVVAKMGKYKYIIFLDKKLCIW